MSEGWAVLSDPGVGVELTGSALALKPGAARRPGDFAEAVDLAHHTVEEPRVGLHVGESNSSRYRHRAHRGRNGAHSVKYSGEPDFRWGQGEHFEP
jgi:hypothetical protein